MLDENLRKKWLRKVMKKTSQVIEDYKKEYDCEVDLIDALVGVVADGAFQKEIPRVIVRDSEGKKDENLFKVFNKILEMMRTPTYQTINYTHPEVVQLANRLCSRGSITDGYPERDACYVLDGIFGERNFIYWDKGRELPQYAGDILQDLNRQFGQVRIRLALRQSREFSDLLDLSEKIAYDWEKREHSKDGTVRIDAFSRIELGLRKLEKLVTENKDGKDPMLGAIERLCNIKSRERLPYRAKQYSLRGIPIALPQRLPY